MSRSPSSQELSIVKQGDVGDSFFIIESGAVKCTQVKSNGREVELM
jgi:CRP-like cAMP-binding protein